ncbi:MAG: tetratricopeptide repeat protein [Bryobacterales bacterium]|nr:tetratricopeptide repeat protein [Bryobacterales bacterium]MBV9396534.1 tetratricopeptide repeat protein [Bryobacterales bacterium]
MATRKGRGDPDGAIADFTRAIELRPDYAEAYYFRGLAKRAKGDKDGAVADFMKAIGLKPDYAEAKAQLRTVAGNPAR